MLFDERIKQLRKVHRIPQRKLAAALNISIASYCKIERGIRRPRKEHIPIIAELLQGDSEELLILWHADKVIAMVMKEKKLSHKIIDIAKKQITG